MSSATTPTARKYAGRVGGGEFHGSRRLGGHAATYEAGPLGQRGSAVCSRGSRHADRRGPASVHRRRRHDAAASRHPSGPAAASRASASATEAKAPPAAEAEEEERTAAEVGGPEAPAPRCPPATSTPAVRRTTAPGDAPAPGRATAAAPQRGPGVPLGLRRRLPRAL